MTRRQDVITAYRHLYQHALRAVQYSQPARYVVRDRLRALFRTRSLEHYDAARIRNTLEFLDGAARAKGLEHKIVKTLVHGWYHERRRQRGTEGPRLDGPREALLLQHAAYEQSNHVLRMLNESMSMCL